MIIKLLSDIWLAFWLYWILAGIYTRLTTRIALRGEGWTSAALQWAAYGAAAEVAVFEHGAFWGNPVFARSFPARIATFVIRSTRASWAASPAHSSPIQRTEP